MDTLLQDLRIGARSLWRSPGLTLAVVATLALGIGANSAMFSVVNAVLLHPVRYEDPAALSMVWDRDPDGHPKTVSAGSFVDWRHAKSFSDLAGWAANTYVLGVADHTQQIIGAAVTANFFRTLGVKPVLGRTFLPDEDGLENSANAARVCVIGYKLWQETLGGDPNVLGRSLLLNQTSYAVVGVMPPDFQFVVRQHQVWVPASLDRTNRDFRYLMVVGRLNTAREQASAEMATMAHAQEQEFPKNNKGRTIEVEDFREWLVNRTFRTRLLLLAGALGLVLAAACANVASLLLARSATRTREMAVRISVGATRGRLIRQLLTESVILGLAGGAAGLALAGALIRAAPRLIPANALPGNAPIEWNPAVILFALSISIATGLLFGLAPALAASRPNVQQALKESSRGSSGGRTRQWARRTMVTAQIAVALMLLATAGLMINSLQKLAGFDLGFRPQNVLAWSLFLPSTKYDAARARELHRRAVERIGRLPGVESVAVGSSLPLSGLSMEIPFDLEGAPLHDESEQPGVGYASISPEYLHTLGIPLKRGRGFTESDNETAPPVAIVNEAFVQRFLRTGEPVGQRVVLRRPILGSNQFEPAIRVQIVGVIANVALARVGAEPSPILYVPHAQNVWRRVSWFAARTRTDPASLAGAVRNEMAALDKEQPIDQLGTLDQTFSDQFAEPRFQTFLMGAFSGLALILAMVGVYGLNAHAVAQRSHEIGLRMALGATPGRVLQDIIGEGLKLAAYGIAAGIAGALAIGSVLKSVLVGVSANDPLTLGTAVLLLALVAAAACYIPSRRATHIDPAITLRQE